MCDCNTCGRFDAFCGNPSCPNDECPDCRARREENYDPTPWELPGDGASTGPESRAIEAWNIKRAR